MTEPRSTGARDERRRPALPAARASLPTVATVHLALPLALAASLCIIATEWLAGAPRAELGLVLYGALFIGFLVIARAYERLSPLATAFAIVALSRLITFTAPQPGLGPFENLLIVHLLILLSTVGTLRVLGYRILGRLSVRLARYLPLLLLAGSALGAGTYLLLEPSPIDPTDTFGSVAAGVGLVVAGAAIELLFRNLLMTSAVGVLGRARGLLLTSAVYAVLYLGWASWPVMASGFAAGLLLGALALRLRSPLAAVTTHVMANLTLFGLLPNLFG